MKGNKVPQPVDEIQKLREETEKRRAQLRKKEALERAQITNDKEKAALHRIENPMEYITFAPVWFANFSLPHSDGKPAKNEMAVLPKKEMQLVNGSKKLSLYSRDGLPSGVIARKFLFWVTTQAVLRKNRPEAIACYIPVKNLQGIMKEMDIKKTGGAKGTYSILRTQMNRVLKLAYYEDQIGSVNLDEGEDRHISKRRFFKWEHKSEKAVDLSKDSHFILTEDFFREITNHGAIPLDKRILSKLTRSPLCYDLYVWLTYRIAHQTTYTRVTFDQLHKQFATGYPDTERGRRNFRANVKTAFSRVFQAWEEVTGTPPAAKLSGNGILLCPGGEPSVPKKISEQVTEETKEQPAESEPPF